jgi:hypothetical protein
VSEKVKKFPVEAVLTVAYDKLLCDIGIVYEICNFLSGDNLYTHQLPRAHRILSPWIFEQYPMLRNWDETPINNQNYREYVELARQRFGDSLMVTRISRDRWTHIDPLEEIGAMVGDKNIIVVRP